MEVGGEKQLVSLILQHPPKNLLPLWVTITLSAWLFPSGKLAGWHMVENVEFIEDSPSEGQNREGK
jgi:hypothetical protein